jgi:hypothetical protein
MEKNKVIVKDIFGVDREYQYSHIVLEKKSKNKRQEPTKEHHILFYTVDDADDTLRYVEDAAEEISNQHRTPKEKTHFFEVQKNKKWEIEMRWDNKRYRGTSWVPIESFPWEDV